jgi:hypothetical protein
MKSNLIHVCFIIDESGSMYGSENDVVGGFNKTINEQKAIEEGECLVSYFKFSDNVKEMFVGRKLDDVKPMTVGQGFWQKSWSNNIGLSNSATVNVTLDATLGDIVDNLVNGDDDTFVYSPNGCTAMNDGIGAAIDRIGKWLARMPEEERPSKNLIVIMTDGEENASREYSLKQVKDMIQHQTEKYNWTFVYMGMDITSVTCAENLGISNRSYSSKSSTDTYQNYTTISNAATSYRMSAASVANDVLESQLCSSLKNITESYETKIGIKIE